MCCLLVVVAVVEVEGIVAVAVLVRYILKQRETLQRGTTR
jgi:hypothetical protein